MLDHTTRWSLIGIAFTLGAALLAWWGFLYLKAHLGVGGIVLFGLGVAVVYFRLFGKLS